MLLELGFDLQLLGSERYVKARLETLAPEQLSKVREVFVRNSHLVDTSRLAKPLTTSRSSKMLILRRWRG